MTIEEAHMKRAEEIIKARGIDPVTVEIVNIDKEDPFSDVDLSKLPKKELQNICDHYQVTYEESETKQILIEKIQGAQNGSIE